MNHSIERAISKSAKTACLVALTMQLASGSVSLAAPNDTQSLVNGSLPLPELNSAQLEKLVHSANARKAALKTIAKPAAAIPATVPVKTAATAPAAKPAAPVTAAKPAAPVAAAKPAAPVAAAKPATSVTPVKQVVAATAPKAKPPEAAQKAKTTAAPESAVAQTAEPAAKSPMTLFPNCIPASMLRPYADPVSAEPKPAEPAAAAEPAQTTQPIATTDRPAPLTSTNETSEPKLRDAIPTEMTAAQTVKTAEAAMSPAPAAESANATQTAGSAESAAITRSTAITESATATQNTAAAETAAAEKTPPASAEAPRAVAMLVPETSSATNTIIIDNDEAVEQEATIKFEALPTDDGKTKAVAGAKFPIVIVSELSSKSAKVGDSIQGRLKYDLKIGDRLVAQKGSPVMGHINYALHARTPMKSLISANRWYRNSGCLGVQFDEIINERNEHIPLVAEPAKQPLYVKNKGEGRELGINHKGQITGPWSQQLKYKAVRIGMNAAMAPLGTFTFGAMPVALGVMGAINPSFAFMKPVGLNVRHRRIKGFCWGALSGVPGSWLIEDTTVKGQEAIIKPGDEFLAELRQEFTGTPATDAEMMDSANQKVHGEVVGAVNNKKKKVK